MFLHIHLLTVLVTNVILNKSFASRIPLEHHRSKHRFDSLLRRKESFNHGIILNSDLISNPSKESVFPTENAPSSVTTKVPIRQAERKHPLLFDWTASCAECNVSLCEVPPSDCSAGLRRDACDCCYVCGNLEGTSCDLPGFEFRYGQCSDGLVCQPPLLPAENAHMPIEGYCACSSVTVLCGSDGRIYTNPCRFNRARARKPTLGISHEGPCLAAPLVEIPPMNQSAESGSSAVFSCTVSGFPFAWFEWFKDGENVFQPGLSDHVTVQIRNGPLTYQVTSWLQINRIHPTNNGFYTCIAKNPLGETNSTAFLEVIDDDFDDSSYYVFRGKHYQLKNNVTAGGKIMKEILIDHHSYARSLQLPNSNESVDTNIPEDKQYDDTNDSSNANLNQVVENMKINRINNTRDGVDVLVQTLEELVKPKEFKDIFFDDDDFTEGSGTDNQLM